MVHWFFDCQLIQLSCICVAAFCGCWVRAKFGLYSGNKNAINNHPASDLYGSFWKWCPQSCILKMPPEVYIHIMDAYWQLFLFSMANTYLYLDVWSLPRVQLDLRKLTSFGIPPARRAPVWLLSSSMAWLITPLAATEEQRGSQDLHVVHPASNITAS